MPSPSQKEIARLLGVSQTTVSRALLNSPKVGKQVRAQVLETASRLGYQVNPWGRGLAGQRRSTPAQLPLGYLNLLKKIEGAGNLQIYEGCRRRAEELGYYLDVIPVRAQRLTSRRITQILLNRGIRGVLIGLSPYSYSHLNLKWEHFAAVTVNFTFRRPNFHRTAINLPMSLQLALHQLKRLSYRRVGLLLDPTFVSRMGGDPVPAFLHYQSEIPKQERVPILWSSFEKFSHVISAWLKKHRPDVILSYWGSVYRWLIAAGYSIPEQIGFVSLDWFEISNQRSGVELTGLDLGNEVLGSRAVDLLVSQVEHNEFGIPKDPTITLITPRWVQGKTIRSSAGVSEQGKKDPRSPRPHL